MLKEKIITEQDYKEIDTDYKHNKFTKKFGDNVIFKDLNFSVQKRRDYNN